MRLFSDTRTVTGWILQVLRQCFRVTGRTTFAVVAASLVARVTRMLTFLLPLKVILLAGSDGIPRYFRFFLAPDQKELGVIALSGAAVACYAITLALEAREKRLAEAGSADLLAASGVMTVVSNQNVQAQGFYARFTRIAASMLFALAALLALTVLDAPLAAFLVGICLCFYLLTVRVLRDVGPLRRTRLSDFISDRFGEYLKILSSVAFLSSFLVIIYQLVATESGSILVAIICFVLLRQLLTALTGSVRDAVSLAGQQALINTLVFPDHKLQPVEAKNQRTLRDLFAREERESRIAQELSGLIAPEQALRIEWRDPAVRGMAEFSIRAEGGDAPARHFRQHVFPPRLRRLLDNEDLLFRHIDREALWAPPVVHRYHHGEHDCVIYDVGTGDMPTARHAKETLIDRYVNLWCAVPPQAFLKIYSSSHRLLHERLADDFVSRLEIAADSREENDTLDGLRAVLPEIRAVLAGLPVRVVNPHLVRDHAVTRPDGGLYFLNWSQWSLEPIGVGLPSLISAAGKQQTLLDDVRRHRPGMLDASLTPAHLQLAMACAELERCILQGRMKSGLKRIGRILDEVEAIRGESQSGKLERSA